MFEFDKDKLKTALDEHSIEANQRFVVARGAQGQWYLIVEDKAIEVQL